MYSRKPFRSVDLQKEFIDIYKDFFGKNKIVTSSCLSFFWNSVGVGHRSKYVNIKSKIPLKCFVGLNKLQPYEVKISSFDCYNSIDNSFEKINFSQVNQKYQAVLEIIQQFLQDNNFKFGVDISILSELPRGHGLGFTGSFASSLVFALFAINGKISKELLNNYNKFINSDVFRQIRYLAWQIEFVSKHGNSCGENSLNALTNNPLPTAFFCEQFDCDIESQELINICYKFFPIFDKFKGDLQLNDLPVDVHVVYSGYPSYTDKIEQFKKSDINKFNKLSEFVKCDLITLNLDKDDYYFKKFIQDGSFYNMLSDNLTYLSLQTLNYFKKFVEGGYDFSLVDDFIDSINNQGYISAMIEKTTNFMDDFWFHFEKNKINSNEKVGIMPIYSGKLGGDYLVVTKQGLSRQTIDKTISQISIMYPNVFLDHVSYIDGFADQGVKIENYADMNIFSQIIPMSNVVYKDNFGKVYIDEYKNIVENEQNGILFDAVNKKVYINGKKITSKDLLSQSGTIEIFDILLENYGNKVHNNLLPASGYSKDKNEMVSKIIVPFNKLVFKNYGIKLELLCTGTLIDYDISLNEKQIKLGIIKKIR